MITLEQAVKLAEMAVGRVDSILDCGDRWAFDFCDERDKLGAISMFVFKEDGDFAYFSYAMDEYREILNSGVVVLLPRKVENSAK